MKNICFFIFIISIIFCNINAAEMQQELWQPTILQRGNPQRRELYPIEINADDRSLVQTLFENARQNCLPSGKNNVSFKSLPLTFQETILKALTRVTNDMNPIPFHPDFTCNIGTRSKVKLLNSSDYIHCRLPINKRRYDCLYKGTDIIADAAGYLMKRIQSGDLQGMCIWLDTVDHSRFIDFCTKLPKGNPWRVYKHLRRRRQYKWSRPQSIQCQARFFHLALSVYENELYFSKVYLD